MSIVFIMNQVEESVLIPKDQYETLMEKVAGLADKSNVSVDSNLCNFDKSNEPANVSDVTVPTGSKHESSGDSATVNSIDNFENVDNVLNNQVATSVAPAEKVAKSSMETKTSASVEDKTDTAASNSRDDTDTEPDSASPTAKKKFEFDTEKYSVKNPRKPSLNKLLIGKVPEKLREPAKQIVQYILEYGNGIIRWDEKLRFVHLNQKVSRTNFAKMISYLMEKTDRRPKGMTILKKSLQSIGIDNPKIWAKSLAAKFGKPDQNESLPKQSSDTMDGVSEDMSKSLSGKHARLQKLAGKWESW